MKLSAQQKEAVEYIGTPALVVAGAGSGKTRTLTAKIIHLISKGFASKRILAITFTNKAAKEMKNRLIKATGMHINNFPWVRTYHSAYYKILKKHCTLIGYQLPLQILSPYHQQKEFTKIISKLNFDKKHVPAIMSLISKAKNYGNPQKYFDQNPQVSQIFLDDIFDLYEKELKKKNAVDFDNILLLTRDILRNHKNIRNYYKDLYQYILIDEYQDSNNLQEELTRLCLKDGNLFCVGDDWQSVYGFRGSNVNHFLSFEHKYKKSKIFRLEQNYRSANKIVQIANNLINYNSKKIDKRCYSEKKGGVVEILNLYNETEEAKWVAQKIMFLNHTGIHNDNIAVIYRTKALSLSFEKTFRAYSIPYKMMGAKGFFNRKEILDINCYLTAAVFPKDDVAFERIINTPKRGIGPGMLKKIGNMKSENMSLQEATRKVLSKRILSLKINKLLTELFIGLDFIKELKPDLAIKALLNQFDYMNYLKDFTKNDKSFTSREENIEQLIYAASQNNTILDYLEEAALIREDTSENKDKEGYGVNLATVHASKGLEYLAVFIAGCEENIFPHWKSLNTEIEIQEERRLMYVAITRAKKYLFLTSSSFRRGKQSYPSRFINEIKEETASLEPNHTKC